VSPPEISRDPQDDYLLALAVVHEADYLVTRDRDLLDLGEVVGVKIVDPVTFLALLRSTTESP
jgi:predicted nucleic acid-binding protein